MRSGLVRLEDLHEWDPNRLPYFVTEFPSRKGVPVLFERLTASDLLALSGTEWAGAVQP